MSEDDFAASNWVWVPDKDELFVRGNIAEYLDNGIVKVTVKNGTHEYQREIEQKRIENCNPAKFNKCNDMAELTHLNEPSVIYNLFLRYSDDLIYTYSGLFLVAINPYKKLPIYESSDLRTFHTDSELDERLPPHIFAIAESTHRNLIANRKDQLILVTGESGAGKTENTKKIIQYLSSISASDEAHGEIHEKILRANPLLESFGNAKTIKNNNSSRFGKFIKIYFNTNGFISGAQIDYYLLEKSRVLHQLKDERNYHAFYQILKGLDENSIKKLDLSRDPHHFKYLQSSVPSISGVDDEKEFNSLKDAFKIMGFSDGDVESVFTVMAAILHFGNVDFTSWTSEQANFTPGLKLEFIASLLGVNSDELSRNLLRPKVKAGREFVQKLRKAAEVKFVIDAFAKHLYEKVFQFILLKINQSLEGGDSNAENFIGVLDIAGFEIFQSNSFEQLCINYTNEKLQQFFNHHSFILEQSEYLREDIQWEFIDFGLDLQPTIDLIETKNPMGILETLNEQCIMPSGSESEFMNKLLDTWGNGESKKFRPNKVRSGFIIDHYAGLVEYNIEDWIRKNTDPVSDNLVQLMPESSNDFIRSLFSGTVQTSNTRAPRLKSVSQKHKEQLSCLMTELGKTEPHFVRCILPNMTKLANKFDKELVLHQLRCNGVLEGIRIARAGYPNKMTFGEFFGRYSILCANDVVYTKSMKSNCELILKHVDLSPETFKIGLTKLFFKNGILAKMEEIRDQSLKKIITSFQTAVRGQLARTRIKKQIQDIQASQVVARNLRTLDGILLKDESPWLKLFFNLKPMLEESVKILDSKEVNEKMKEVSVKLKDAQSAKETLEVENASLKSRLSTLEDDIIKSSSNVAEKAGELERLKKSEKSLNSKISDLSSQIQDFKKLNDKLAREHTGMISEVDKLKSELEESQKDYCRVQKDYSDQKELASALETKVRDLDHKSKALTKAHDEIEAFKRQTENHAAILEEFGKTRAIVVTLEEKLRHLKDIESKHEDSRREVAALNEEILLHKEARDKIEAQLQDATSTNERSLQSHQDSISSLKGKLNAAEETIRDLEEKVRSFETEKNKATKELEKVKNDFEDQKRLIVEDKTSDLLIATKELERNKDKVQYLESELREKRSIVSEQTRKLKDAEAKLVQTQEKLQLVSALETELSQTQAKSAELAQTITETKNQLFAQMKENKSLSAQFESMKHEISFLNRSKSELLEELSNSKAHRESLQSKLLDKENLPPTHGKADPRIMEELANFKLKLNEASANVRREKFENQKLTQEVNMLRQKVNAAFESPSKRSEMRRSLAIGENLGLDNINDTKHLEEIKQLKSRIHQEEANVARAEVYAIELQKKLNKLQMTRGVDTFSDYEAKYKDSHLQVQRLEKRIESLLAGGSSPIIEEQESMSRSSSFGNVNGAAGGSGDLAKIYKGMTKTLKITREELSGAKKEILRLKSLLRESEDELYEFKRLSVKTSIADYEQEIATLKVSKETTSKEMEEIRGLLNKYQKRSEEYYDKLELAESAVTISKRHADQSRKELEEKSTELIMAKEELRAMDKVMRGLRHEKNELDMALAKLRHREETLLGEVKAARARIEYLDENYGDRKRTIENHKDEIRQLHEDVKFRMEKETEVIKENKRLKIDNEELTRIKTEVLAENADVVEENERLVRQADSLSKEVMDLKDAKSVLERKAEQNSKQIADLRELMEENSHQIESLTVELKELKARRDDLQAKLDDSNDGLRRANENLELLREHVELLEKEKAERKEEVEAVRQKWDISEKGFKDARSEGLVLVQENESLKTVNKDLKEQVSRLKEKLYLNEQLKYLEDSVAKVNQEADNLRHSLFEGESREHALKKQVATLEFEKENLSQNMKRYNDENFNFQNMVGQYKSQVEYLHHENNEKDLKIKSQDRELAELKEKLLQIERAQLRG